MTTTITTSPSCVRAALAVPPNVRLSDLDPSATPCFPGTGPQDAAQLTTQLSKELGTWQEKLYAGSKAKPTPPQRMLVVLQGMDTAGKSGVVRHVFGLVDPQGVKIHAFKQPTEEELAHDFLWRIEKQVPPAGYIGIFDRSQYEDVLVVRVDELVPPSQWEPRFEQINQFEASLVDSGVTIIKFFLHISPDEQKARLLGRLNNPNKYWKYSPGDIPVRSKWAEYMAAYEDVLNRCNQDIAPWYAIPSNNKWYRNWAIANILLDHLRQMNPAYPGPSFDVDEQITAVENSL
ncbi:MAG: polyphosphate kinase 2 family protein [Propionibacteriaceae bacterium]|nr:polyphosphate kinase 2 family protein [Propionibacteriaceae bacterium]